MKDIARDKSKTEENQWNQLSIQFYIEVESVDPREYQSIFFVDPVGGVPFIHIWALRPPNHGWYCQYCLGNKT